jgi:hypothetical protein
MEELLVFKSQVELAIQQAQQGNHAARERLCRWRRKMCELTRASIDGDLSPITTGSAAIGYVAADPNEERSIVRRWVRELQPLLFDHTA